jgi:hypothetical protein
MVDFSWAITKFEGLDSLVPGLCSNPSKSTTFCNMGSLRMLTTCLVIRFVANVYFIIGVYNY